MRARTSQLTSGSSSSRAGGAAGSASWASASWVAGSVEGSVGLGVIEGETNGGAADTGLRRGLTADEDSEGVVSWCSRSYSDMVDRWDMERCVFCGRDELSGGNTGDACAGYDMVAELVYKRKRKKNRCVQKDRGTRSKVSRCHHPGSLLNRCFESRNARLARLGPLVADTAPPALLPHDWTRLRLNLVRTSNLHALGKQRCISPHPFVTIITSKKIAIEKN